MQRNLVYLIAFFACSILSFSGCAQTQKYLQKFKKKEAKTAPKTQRTSPAKPSKPKFDPEAQQRGYDRGLKLFSQENYPAAQRAWKEAVDMNPASPVGKKSQENLQKVEKILESLREIEQQ